MPSSFLTPNFSPTPKPTIGQTVMPTASVGSFQNQAIGAANAGLGIRAAQLSPTQVALGQKVKDSAVQLSATKRQDAVKASGQRLTQLAQAAAQKRLQQAGGGASNGSMANVGRAYTPDGNLSASRNRVLGLASSYIGSPYVLGGTTKQGIDCSGLVQMVYNQLGYNVSQHSAGWQKNNIPGVRTSVANLRPGDIVAWKDGSHIAIYAGNGEIIEAANERVGTVRRKLWSNDVIGIALRLPGE